MYKKRQRRADDRAPVAGLGKAGSYCECDVLPATRIRPSRRLITLRRNRQSRVTNSSAGKVFQAFLLQMARRRLRFNFGNFYLPPFVLSLSKDIDVSRCFFQVGLWFDKLTTNGVRVI